MNICVVLEHRSEVVKLAPIIHSLLKEKASISIVYPRSSSCYCNTVERLFKEFNLPDPVKLDFQDCVNPFQLSVNLNSFFSSFKPEALIVKSGGLSSFISAFTAVSRGIPVVSIDAGCRCFNLAVPQELYRVLTDRCSQLLFPLTDLSLSNLLREGFPPTTVKNYGNPIFDAIAYVKPLAKNSFLDKLELNDYMLMVVESIENSKVKSIVKTLDKINVDKVLLVSSPDGLSDLASNKTLVFPITDLSYRDYILLLSSSKLVLTDSTCVQEEAVITKTPCLTLREDTERPEIVLSGGNVLVGLDLNNVFKWVNRVLKREQIYSVMKRAKPPFKGRGASDKIAREIAGSLRSGGLRVGCEWPVKGYPTLKLSLDLEKSRREWFIGFFNEQGKYFPPSKKKGVYGLLVKVRKPIKSRLVKKRKRRKQVKR